MGIERFIEAQEKDFAIALSEINNGKKHNHWMWYTFPQIAGLGSTQMSKFYSIKDLSEAETYFFHPILGKRLIEISYALLNLQKSNATEIFGSPDDLKLRSSMTLFSLVPEADPVFEAVLNKFFNGVKDKLTLQQLKKV